MKEKKLTWYDVTLWQFQKLQKLIQIEDEQERLLDIAELLLGKEITYLPIKEFTEECKQLSFLQDEIPQSVPPKNITLNGRKYFVDCLVGTITTAQYVDFTNHLKGTDIAATLSVFVIPDGHKYNDGYDMLQVINDIQSLPMPIVNSISFFFSRQFNEFMRIFQSCSIKRIKKTDLPKKEKDKLIEVVKNSMDLVLSPLYLNSVK